jgi:hypothetical protein
VDVLLRSLDAVVCGDENMIGRIADEFNAERIGIANLYLSLSLPALEDLEASAGTIPIG